jgi:putative transposase
MGGQNYKHLAHPSPVERFNQPTVIFLTVCARVRTPLYDKARAHEALLHAWENAHQWHVAEYVIMPDHLHLFCVPGVLQPEPIRNWTRYWKRLAGIRCRALKSSWQDDVFDRQLRTREQLEEKRHYVRMNPVRAELCDAPDDWPFRGVLREILW